MVRSYDRRRPRATVWWWRLIALATAVFAITVWYRGPKPFRNWPYQSWLWLLRGVEIAFGIAVSFWIVFHAAAIAVHIAGSLAVSKADERGRRARWTARLTLILSALAFIVLSTALWAGITRRVFADDPRYNPLLPFAFSDAQDCPGFAIRLGARDAMGVDVTDDGTALDSRCRDVDYRIDPGRGC